MARYVVTGGAGFIGSNLVEALLRQGEDVVAFDNFATGRRENLDAVDEWSAAGGGSFRLFEGDIRDPDMCRDALDGANFVLHQAAIPSVQRSVDDPKVTNEVNVGGTLNLLVAARDANVDRFVFASSSSIYGESETLPKIETMPPDPISPYGLQKFTGETYCILFHRLYGLPTVALRYFNVFGPRQDPTSDYAAVIPRFITAIRNGGRPTIYGDGEQTRDFTFVKNVVRANLLACQAGSDAFGIAANVGCADRISLNRLVEEIAGLVGVEVRAEYTDPRAGDIRHSLAAIDRARKHLGFEPEYDLIRGLTQTVDAY